MTFGDIPTFHQNVQAHDSPLNHGIFLMGVYRDSILVANSDIGRFPQWSRFRLPISHHSAANIMTLVVSRMTNLLEADSLKSLINHTATQLRSKVLNEKIGKNIRSAMARQNMLPFLESFIAQKIKLLGENSNVDQDIVFPEASRDQFIRLLKNPINDPLASNCEIFNIPENDPLTEVLYEDVKERFHSLTFPVRLEKELISYFYRNNLISEENFSELANYISIILPAYENKPEPKCLKNLCKELFREIPCLQQMNITKIVKHLKDLDMTKRDEQILTNLIHGIHTAANLEESSISKLTESATDWLLPTIPQFKITLINHLFVSLFMDNDNWTHWLVDSEHLKQDFTETWVVKNLPEAEKKAIANLSNVKKFCYHSASDVRAQLKTIFTKQTTENIKDLEKIYKLLEATQTTESGQSIIPSKTLSLKYTDAKELKLSVSCDLFGLTDREIKSELDALLFQCYASVTLRIDATNEHQMSYLKENTSSIFYHFRTPVIKDISRSQMTELAPSFYGWINKFTEIKEIELNKTKIDSKFLNSIKSKDFLLKLSFKGCEFSDDFLSNLADIPLTSLNLSSCPITTKPVQRFLTSFFNKFPTAPLDLYLSDTKVNPKLLDKNKKYKLNVFS